MNWKLNFKIALAGMIAAGLGLAVHMTFLGNIVVLVFAMMCVQTTVGESYETTKGLLQWTIIGSIVGTVTIALFDPYLTAHPESKWILMFVFAILGAIMLPLGRYARIGLITTISVVILGNMQHQPVQTGASRALYMIIAALIGFLISNFIFPSRVSDQLKEKIHFIFSTIEQLLQEAFEAMYSDNPWDVKKHIACVVQVFRELDNYGLMTEQASHEGLKLSDKTVHLTILFERLATVHIRDIIRLVEACQSNPIMKTFKPELAQLQETIVKNIKHIHQLALGNTIKSLTPSSEVVQSVNEILEEKRTLLRVHPIKQVTDFFYFYTLLCQILYDIDLIHDRFFE